jgi:hypothetical protein
MAADRTTKAQQRLDALVEFLQLSGGQVLISEAKENWPLWDDWMFYDTVKLARRSKIVRTIQTRGSGRNNTLQLVGDIDPIARTGPVMTPGCAPRGRL